MKGKKNIEIFVTFPKGRISREQRLQMTTVPHQNVTIISNEKEGIKSDDYDIAVNQLYEDIQFKNKFGLISFNSVNIVRPIIEIAHYFYIFLKIDPLLESKLNFAVPTGQLFILFCHFYLIIK